MGIVGSKCLWATDIRFFNDSSELSFILGHLKGAIDRRLHLSHQTNQKLLEQFRNWTKDRISGNGHTLYVTSFTTNGNLLSQWRGYCPDAKGISLGFNDDILINFGASQSFGFAKCIYDINEQRSLAEQIVSFVEILGNEKGEQDRSKRHPSQSFYDVFESIENDILHIASLFKHPSFHEEQEWRAVSEVMPNYVESPIEYRDGLSTLIPFIKLNLPTSETNGLNLEHVYLGPTPNTNNSMAAISQFLSKARSSPNQGIAYCSIPYRTW